MKFSIITPSFRNSQWLKLCVASVADQSGVEVEHIIQDAGSDDGTLEWLLHDHRVQVFVEKDDGMYDAINRGFKRATGEILAYLNCDEQYLPESLSAVHDFFAAHPPVDVVCADAVVVDTKGDYICHRYSLVPLKHHVWLRFAVLTCAVFVRRRVVQDLGIHFDPKWRALGDAFWLLDLVNRGVRISTLRRFTSVFTETGGNLGLSPGALHERDLRNARTPRWIRTLAPAIVCHHRLRMLASGALFQKPFDYALYTLASPDQRVSRYAAKPTPRWQGRC